MGFVSVLKCWGLVCFLDSIIERQFTEKVMWAESSESSNGASHVGALPLTLSPWTSLSGSEVAISFIKFRNMGYIFKIPPMS